MATIQNRCQIQKRMQRQVVLAGFLVVRSHYLPYWNSQQYDKSLALCVNRPLVPTPCHSAAQENGSVTA